MWWDWQEEVCDLRDLGVGSEPEGLLWIGKVNGQCVQHDEQQTHGTMEQLCSKKQTKKNERWHTTEHFQSEPMCHQEECPMFSLSIMLH